MGLKIEHLDDFSRINDFRCGVEVMDAFIHGGFRDSVEGHYCVPYIVTDKDNGNVVALFALSFDSLFLDCDDKDELMVGLSAERPNVPFDYEDTFFAKRRYPSLDIAYLAVDERYRNEGIGMGVIDMICIKARQQNFAGCQFITVDAYNTRDYTAVPFYYKCRFTACELPDPSKDTLRMYKTLYAIQNSTKFGQN